MLEDMHRDLKDRGIRIAFATVGNRVEQTLRVAGTLDKIGKHWFCPSVHAAVQFCVAHQAKLSGGEQRKGSGKYGANGSTKLALQQVLAVQMEEEGEDEDDATPSSGDGRVENLDPQKKRPSCAALTADRQESDGKVSLGGYGSNYGSELDLAGMEAGHKAPVGTDGAAGIGLSRAAADNVDCTADSHVSSSTREQPPTNNGVTDESPGASRWSSALAI